MIRPPVKLSRAPTASCSLLTSGPPPLRLSLILAESPGDISTPPCHLGRRSGWLDASNDEVQQAVHEFAVRAGSLDALLPLRFIGWSEGSVGMVSLAGPCDVAEVADAAGQPGR